jgi:hypothetical protein
MVEDRSGEVKHLRRLCGANAPSAAIQAVESKEDSAVSGANAPAAFQLDSPPVQPAGFFILSPAPQHTNGREIANLPTGASNYRAHEACRGGWFLRTFWRW